MVLPTINLAHPSAWVVKELLRSMGVGEGEYDPRVLHQFLELGYRYVVDVLFDAQVYADHAGKLSIDPDDIRLAIQSKVNFSFSQPAPREVTPPSPTQTLIIFLTNHGFHFEPLFLPQNCRKFSNIIVLLSDLVAGGSSAFEFGVNLGDKKFQFCSLGLVEIWETVGLVFENDVPGKNFASKLRFLKSFKVCCFVGCRRLN